MIKRQRAGDTGEMMNFGNDSMQCILKALQSAYLIIAYAIKQGITVISFAANQVHLTELLRYGVLDSAEILELLYY